MSLYERYEKSLNRWAETGDPKDRLKSLLLFCLWAALTPTPALGFVVGAIATVTMVWLTSPLFSTMPLVAAVLIASEIGGLAWIWQIVYQAYWRNAE